MTRILKSILALFALAAPLAAQAADGTFTIAVDDPARVTVTMQHGYGGDIETFTPVGNVFTVDYGTYWDVFITPKEGFRVKSITGKKSSGAAIDSENAGWKFNVDNDSYSIYGSSFNVLNGNQYTVETEVYTAPSWNITVDINDIKALSGGTFKAGNSTITAVAGENKFTINPDKGKACNMILTPSVLTAQLTLNGNVVVPDTSYTGALQYKFDLTDNAVVKLNATMENPVCYIVADDPAHIVATYPNSETPLTLKKGRNELTYTVGSTLTLAAAEGYKLNCSDNLTYNSSSKTYSVYFSGGQSGQEYIVNSEVYVAPMAYVTLNLVDSTLVTYANFTPGYNPVRTFFVGDNKYEYNTDDVNHMEIDYKGDSENEIIAACNDTLLEISKSFYGDLCSQIDLKAGEYYIAVRARLSGDFTGTYSLESDEKHELWTLSFNPGGILEIADATATVDLLSDGKKVATAQTEIKKGIAYMAFSGIDTLPNGTYTVSVPAGMFRVNGALAPAASKAFEVHNEDSVESIFAPDARHDVFAIDGRIVCRDADASLIRSLAPGIYIVAGKKLIIK